MDAATILEGLNQSSPIPKRALLAAREYREELVPRFLREIDEFLASEGETYPKPDLLFCAFHLLGEWRETRAYRPLARLLRHTRETLEWLLSDAVTESSHRVMVQVFDGDFAPLSDIILDQGASVYSRWCMFETMTVLTAQGKLPLGGTQAFLIECFECLQPREDSEVWYGWVEAIASLSLTGLGDLAKQVFESGWIDPQFITIEQFEQDLKAAAGGHQAGQILARYKPLDNAVTELSHWYDSPPPESDDSTRPFSHEDVADWVVGMQPYTQLESKPSRNDPCPCGSGKKFKKCCIHGAKTPIFLAR